MEETNKDKPESTVDSEWYQGRGLRCLIIISDKESWNWNY